ncbi:uncharacterized protein LOC126273319 [Schistocerca gregaria]|uniref:uncharacterized protein LOC126273319 n=1 Tax=Schistocerca gregaria TaxID=7010 RepID=UPI00211E6C2C|nr:uncharacterized protein LOC126273319 [Schistocerca gregaria]
MFMPCVTHSLNLVLGNMAKYTWESHFESIRPVRHWLGKVCEVFEKAAKSAKDSSVLSEAMSLVNHSLNHFEFVLALMTWHNFLHAVNEIKGKPDIGSDETLKHHKAKDRFRIEYFSVVIAEALSDTRSKLRELMNYSEYFGFLFHLFILCDMRKLK